MLRVQRGDRAKLARRDAGDRSKFAVEVGLIRESGGQGHVDDVRPDAIRPDRPVRLF